LNGISLLLGLEFRQSTEVVPSLKKLPGSPQKFTAEQVIVGQLTTGVVHCNAVHRKQFNAGQVTAGSFIAKVAQSRTVHREQFTERP
jgi:hypothetical protein